MGKIMDQNDKNTVLYCEGNCLWIRASSKYICVYINIELHIIYGHLIIRSSKARDQPELANKADFSSGVR